MNNIGMSLYPWKPSISIISGCGSTVPSVGDGTDSYVYVLGRPIAIIEWLWKGISRLWIHAVFLMLLIPIRDASVGDHDEFLLLRTNLCWKSLDAGGMFVAVVMVWLVQWICAHWDPGDASKNEDFGCAWIHNGNVDSHLAGAPSRGFCGRRQSGVHVMMAFDSLGHWMSVHAWGQNHDDWFNIFKNNRN